MAYCKLCGGNISKRELIGNNPRSLTAQKKVILAMDSDGLCVFCRWKKEKETK